MHTIMVLVLASLVVIYILALLAFACTICKGRKKVKTSKQGNVRENTKKPSSEKPGMT